MTTKKKAPGKAHRKGISLLQLGELFPNEEAAVQWFETVRWPDAVTGQESEDRPCPRCGDCDTHVIKSGKPMPYRCRGCKRYFSVRTGSVLECSRLPLRKWAYAMYLWMTSLKGVSSIKLHRDLGITQKSAWHLAHRLREAFSGDPGPFDGPVEVDEVYMGGKRKNMHQKQRDQLEGRGAAGKTAIIGIKDRPSNQVRATRVPNVTSETLSRFIMEHVKPGAKSYTDDSRVYLKLPNHEAVRHSVGEYVRGQAHTNGIESFWSMLKRAYAGTFHKMSPKHLERYVREFSGRHNVRELDTLDQMRLLVMAVVGRRLMYRDLTADNGLDAGARS